MNHAKNAGRPMHGQSTTTDTPTASTAKPLKKRGVAILKANTKQLTAALKSEGQGSYGEVLRNFVIGA